jgi:UTP:GlnB (protein PII) uridylyltransferase
MTNRNLSSSELANANGLIVRIRQELEVLSAGDPQLLFAYRRKIHKELGYDERGKPMHRKLLKLKKMIQQSSKCAICDGILPDKYCVLDRLNAIDGYTIENTRLIHAECDTKVQSERGYA